MGLCLKPAGWAPRRQNKLVSFQVSSSSYLTSLDRLAKCSVLVLSAASAEGNVLQLYLCYASMQTIPSTRRYEVGANGPGPWVDALDAIRLGDSISVQPTAVLQARGLWVGNVFCLLGE